MRIKPAVRILLHLANFAAILFFMLPLLAVLFGAFQSEKSLHADTRGL
jgi:hypothetical protein